LSNEGHHRRLLARAPLGFGVMSNIAGLAKLAYGMKFIRDVGILQLGKAVALVVGFVGSVVFARILGPENYGLYAIVAAFAGIVSSFINFGVWSTTVNLISKAIGRQDREEVRNIIIYFLKVTLLVTNVLWLLVVIFAPQLVTLVYGDVSLANFLRLNVLVNISAVSFLLLSLTYQVFRNITKLIFLETTKKILAVSVSIIFVAAGFGVAGIFYGLLITELIFLIVSIVLLSRIANSFPLFPSFEEVVKNFWQVRISKYLKFSLQIAADKNLNNFVVDAPTFMLGILSTPEQAGLFKVAHSIGTLPKIFSSNISRLLATVFPLKDSQDPGSLKIYYKKVAKWGTMLTFGMVAAVFIGTLLFFRLLYGQEYLPALPALYIVLGTNLLLGYAVSFSPVIRTMKKMAASIGLNVLALILTILIGLIAIPKFGALGAAFSMFGWFFVSIILIFKIESWLKS